MAKKYIDADEFEKLVASHTDYGSTDGEEITFEHIQEWLAEIPAADVQEVRHARWEIASDGYYPYCSACRYEPDKRPTKYCPDCGAIMDGDKK